MSHRTAAGRRRRIDGWGFENESYPPSETMLAWLGERLGEGTSFPSFDVAGFNAPAPAALPELGCDVIRDPLIRLAHARGLGFTDLVRLRCGAVTTLPDGVARPAGEKELERLLATAADRGLRLIPRGGGTSVTGGVNALAGEGPLVTVDLEAFSGLEAFDELSGLATFGAGTTGPGIEGALEPHGFTLGHFPQSWELSTLGGWIATRSVGQESLGYGRIENLVAGLELVAPAGRLRLPSLPASAAGPDLRQLVLGSEGRFGVILRATVRVRRLPTTMRVETAMLGDWESGTEAVRKLVQAGVPLSLLRLSDATETAVAMTLGLARSRLGPLVRGWLRLHGMGESQCLVLFGASGSRSEVARAFERARSVLRRCGAAWLGAGPGRRWLADRFRHPYLRDGLLDHGYGTDTFETAAPWSRLPELYRAMNAAMREAVADGERQLPLLCHLSHPYRDGASLYFTLFFRCPRDPAAAVARWAELKRRASTAIAGAGGTLSHHHGVGSWHAPWYPSEAGEAGLAVVRRAAAELDPTGVMNPHVLLDPSDRLAE